MDRHFTRTFRRCARKDRRQPVLYTNCLLQCFVHSIADCLKNSLMITSLILDGIPLAPKYLRILADGLVNNRNLRNLSLARCRIGDMGCYMLLESLQCNLNLHVLNLSSCCLTNRSATCLSFFFKKRKADLLQNVWKESTLLHDARTTKEEGLQVLILDKNYRFNDIGLKQLIRILKNDFWLKTLCLRCCGITQRGGEIVLELLQTNSVLTQIDLRDNEVSANILQIIRKFLKKRKNKGERIPMKKRLLNHNHSLVQDIVPKNRSCQHASKENRFLKTQTHAQIKMKKDSILQMQKTRHVCKLKRSDKKYTLHTAVNKNHIKCYKADELKNRLSLMIEHNQNLIRDLETSTNFLLEERDRRLSAEEVYHKIQPRLRDLKNKIAMQNSIQSNMRYENQVYANLQNVFNDLKISTNGKILRVDESLSEKANENKIKSNVCYNKNQPFKDDKIVQFFHRRHNCPT
ncbi:PREDICTED: protein Cep78 homolog isoform X1 [Acromyrmex echinatior]|uniref:Protein Cep78-like protein n=2 Tax=Acromyrmex echinatior TaxID=103372 RepID=F4WRM2_ACREC|nr:PREDICTED: protein Cep78 homolog isoform X1 [Acromyrmex echinatior]XP_011058343.1 PREDICTED: protein Cep78 homolog isoform X1 [Acromyrmex echinatior]XP_011058345.1 PREDICTED: protein Cep78 homolog isoform X1 [Acromyrmex echinatior]EGI63167.1 Protein Cep78-like protein [Acromyrmex echinatior]